MSNVEFVNSDILRTQFCNAMSDMYKTEVPLYGKLIELVKKVNDSSFEKHSELMYQLELRGELQRLDTERHGAIRVGSPGELHTLRRMFAVLGMVPVGYYDLTPAGVPVHATTFRPADEAALKKCPFRIFTSLLRPELIHNNYVRDLTSNILNNRKIFSARLLVLIDKYEMAGGLDAIESQEFIKESLQTFRWHNTAAVSKEQYDELSSEHRLIADIVAFKGPHINHLTPRTLDIDTVQSMMSEQGIIPKAIIEGPPKRNCPILLRQTSFKALEEPVMFMDQSKLIAGNHTARFGEIEQRGAALTPKGRTLYDRLLQSARDQLGEYPNEKNAERYTFLLNDAFKSFPDDYDTLRKEKLAYFKYFPTEHPSSTTGGTNTLYTLDELVDAGLVQFEPLVYEDFLPVSAAGIFQSNLGEKARKHYTISAAQEAFHKALGAETINELHLYAEAQRRSIEACCSSLGVTLAD